MHVRVGVALLGLGGHGGWAAKGGRGGVAVKGFEKWRKKSVVSKVDEEKEEEKIPFSLPHCPSPLHSASASAHSFTTIS